MRKSSTTVRVLSAAAIVGLGVAGCGTSGDVASPTSSTPSSAATAKGEVSSAPRPAPVGAADSPEATAKAKSLADAATLDGAVKHLEALQDIANRNGGNRALGSPGYQQSLDYAEKVLRDAGYDVKKQSFVTALWSSSKVEAQIAGAPLPVAALSGSGATKGTLTAKTVVTANLGCEEKDLEKVTPGSIAVVQRGTCPFGQKYKTAAAKGAAALIVVNNQPGDWRGGTLGLDDGASIPVVGVAQNAPIADGQDMTLTVDAKTVKSETWNLVAETAKGDANNVQMVGAHLDGVTDGPGINDNGTGTAAVLETAVKLGPKADVKNRVRFALWGAEEEGLVGSTHYVASLAPEETKKIARYLNFDMLGSPNGGYFTYDGDGSSKLDGGAGPDGSGVIEQVFRNYFAEKKIPVEAAAFDGRSDYGPFKEAGIPSGGVDTGADKTKTPEQQAAWGGTAGQTFDPNYHSPRDDLANVNRDMYRVSIGAVAWATAYFAAL